jgi:hypothetical protein
MRSGKARTGLVLANGGVATYQHVVCLSTRPRNSPYPEENLLPKILDDEPVPPVDEKATGEATIEVFTAPLI